MKYVRLPSRLLDEVSSLKARLSIIILAGIGTSVLVVSVLRNLGWFPAAAIGGIVALLLVNFVARGTTSRLRDLANAADEFAKGRHDHRVTVHSKDEVGQLSASFNAMADELQSSERFRRDLVANASHELRTPIAATRAVLENMVDGVQDPSPENLRPVLGQVERLGRLVDQLFDLSTLESGTTVFAHEPVNLGAIAHSVAEAMAMRNADHRVNVEASEVGALGTHAVTLDAPSLIVSGDAERLHQVFANLVDNALRYSVASSTPTVTMRLTARAADVDVAVVDNGPGIPPELRDRVFDRFVRVDSSRSSSRGGDGGAGIGLSIVQSIVHGHHGTIRITDPPSGSGCCVLVTLRR